MPPAVSVAPVLVIVCAALGAVVGALLPDLIRHLPWRPAPEGEEGGEASPAPVTYADIAAWPPLRAVLAAVTAGVWAIMAASVGGGVELAAFLVLGALGVAMAYIDLQVHRLPNLLTLAALVAGALLLAAAALLDDTWGDYGRAWLGAAALGGLYLLLALLQPQAMGLGDVKLAGVLGLYLGWLGWGALFLGAFLGFLVGGLVGLVLLAMRRVTLRSNVPYGPSMLLGALAAIAWAERVLDAAAGS